jgi:hypothetical protein
MHSCTERGQDRGEDLSTERIRCFSSIVAVDWVCLEYNLREHLRSWQLWPNLDRDPLPG